MIRVAVTIILCLLSACHHNVPHAAPSSGEDAAFLLPGTYSEQTTIADLQARFGEASVQITRAEAGAGEPGVVLFPDDPTRRAYLTFHDDNALVGLASISVRDARSRWRGKHGVHIGMSFGELRRLNKKAFMFSGFDDQRRGFVHDSWSPALDDDDAQLGAFDVVEEEHMYFGVELGLRGQADDIPAAVYPHDEVSTSSDDPRYPRLGVLVEVTEINATTSLDDEWP